MAHTHTPKFSDAGNLEIVLGRCATTAKELRAVRYIAGEGDDDLAITTGNVSACVWSVRQLELQQAYDAYVNAVTSAERFQSGADLQAVLQDQLNAETAFHGRAIGHSANSYTLGGRMAS